MLKVNTCTYINNRQMIQKEKHGVKHLGNTQNCAGMLQKILREKYVSPKISSYKQVLFLLKIQ